MSHRNLIKVAVPGPWAQACPWQAAYSAKREWAKEQAKEQAA